MAYGGSRQHDPGCSAALRADRRCARLRGAGGGARPGRASGTGDLAIPEAQQTLNVLKDDKKRAALIDTLGTIAKAAPEAAAPKPALPIRSSPGSVGRSS